VLDEHTDVVRHLFEVARPEAQVVGAPAISNQVKQVLPAGRPTPTRPACLHWLLHTVFTNKRVQ
jgi:glutamyl-tRNA reductase